MIEYRSTIKGDDIIAFTFCCIGSPIVIAKKLTNRFRMFGRQFKGIAIDLCHKNFFRVCCWRCRIFFSWPHTCASCQSKGQSCNHQKHSFHHNTSTSGQNEAVDKAGFPNGTFCKVSENGTLSTDPLLTQYITGGRKREAPFCGSRDGNGGGKKEGASRKFPLAIPAAIVYNTPSTMKYPPQAFALRFRSRAMEACEPCQAGNRAALSGTICAARAPVRSGCLRRVFDALG